MNQPADNRARLLAASSILTNLDDILVPSRCALLVIDMQRDFIHSRGWAARHGAGTSRLRAVIPIINRLIEAARRAEVHACYVMMEHGPALDAPNYQALYSVRGMAEDILCAAGSWGARLDDELMPPSDDDLQIVRHSYDGFDGPDLHAQLLARRVETIVATGVVTNLCVQATVQRAFGLGYYVVVSEDATAASEPAAESAALDNFRRYFGAVVSSAVIISRWTGLSPITTSGARR